MALPPENAWPWVGEQFRKWLEDRKPSPNQSFLDQFEQKWPWPDLGLRCPSNKERIVFGIDPARPGSDTVVKVACKYEIDGSVRLVKIYKDGTWD